MCTPRWCLRTTALLYVIYTANIPTPTNVEVAIFIDDSDFMYTPACPVNVRNNNLQAAVKEISSWLNILKIKTDESKVTRVIFTNRR